MNERQERIERLAERWFSGLATEAEERELRELLRREEDLPESLRDVALLFEGFEALAGECMPRAEASGRMASPLVDVPQGPDPEPTGLPPELPHARSGRRMRLFWGVAVAAVVAVGLFLGVELRREPYCYIDGKPVYDREVALQTTAYLDSFALLEMPDQLVDELIDKP